MRVVIDIPKTFYNDITKSDNIHLGEFYSNKLVKIIKKGIPLTESYERLVEEIERVAKEYSDMSLREYRGGLYKAMEIIKEYCEVEECK